MTNELQISTLKAVAETQQLLSTIVDGWAQEGSPFADLYKVVGADGKATISKSKMITAIAVGMELGLSPQLALTMGGRLTPETVFSVIKGRELGLALTHAMQNIVTYTNKEGKITNIIDVKAIHTLLAMHNVKERIIEDYVPDYNYYTSDGQYVPKEMFSTSDGIIAAHIFVYDSCVDPKLLQAAVEEGKTLLERRFENHFKTTVELERDGRIVRYTYSTKDAFQAGFMTKDVYANHTRKMLFKQAIHAAAEIIGGDILQGCVTPEQIMSYNKDPKLKETLKSLDSDIEITFAEEVTDASEATDK